MRRIIWFRRDLRVDDNPLLGLEGEVLPIFIFDTNILGSLKPDDRRVNFIFKHVIKLKEALRSGGLDLKLFIGDPVTIFKSLSSMGFDEVAAGGDYDAYARQRDLEISHLLPFNYLHDTYIFKPDEILKDDRTPYLVFTPFYNKAKKHFTAEHLREYKPVAQQCYSTDYTQISKIDDTKELMLPICMESLGFVPVEHTWQEPDALLDTFDVSAYQQNRDHPMLNGTSNLGIHLRFGTLSIRKVLRFLVSKKHSGVDTEPFFRQLIFRDFYAYLLYHFARIADENYKYRFKGISDKQAFEAFCTARTGVPIIDAGVSQLLQTGQMHNRIRMICASFFTKDLLLPWQWGERFFAEHLLDYDAASNILSWQWSAGTGIDPQPYFRIFNPYLQGKKFDKEAAYIKHWLPMLKAIDTKILHDEDKLFTHTLAHYPHPIVRHKDAAKRAIEMFKKAL